MIGCGCIQHLALCAKADDPEGQLLALSTLASLYEDLEDPELALQHYKQVYPILQPVQLVNVQVLASAILIAKGPTSRAE